MSTKYIKEGRKQRFCKKSRRYSNIDKKRIVRSKVIKKNPEFNQNDEIIINFKKTPSRKRFEKKKLATNSDIIYLKKIFHFLFFFFCSN